MVKKSDNIIRVFTTRTGMRGWLTWLASTGLVLLGLYKLYLGLYEEGFYLFSMAGVAIGLGRKIDKKCEDI